jgi:site-specific DNA-methyltransferase (adenine-specific)
MTLIQATFPTVLPPRRMPFPLVEAFPGMLFDFIAGDPPWLYLDRSCNGAVRDYTPMTIAALKALPVAAVAARDSLLGLWATQTHTPEAIDLMRAWGFEYVTVLFTWFKVVQSVPENGGDGFKMGLGRYTRSANEFMLLGKRGRGLRRLRADIRQVIADGGGESFGAPVLGHSVKPPCVLERIEELIGKPTPTRPYLELFSRWVRRGWHAWGDEVGPWPEQRSGDHEGGNLT